MKKLLYSSADVRQAIIGLFRSSNRRRVAISAFVGDGAEAYLPKPKGLELYCWPKEGGTNPDVLRRLMRRGAEIFFVDGLHMKVYWSQSLGAVLTSANLSTNALGSGNLKEVGVLLDPEELDINRLIQSLRARDPTETDLEDLDQRHKRYVVKNRFITAKSKIMAYDQWYDDRFPTKWKLGWWDSTGSPASEAKRITREEYSRDPEDFIAARHGDTKEGEWILTFKLKKTPSQIKWMFAHYVVEVRKGEKGYVQDYPCQAVQALPLKSYPAYPFRLGRRFANAFRLAIGDFDSDRIKELKSSKPPKSLLELIYKYFRKN